MHHCESLDRRNRSVQVTHEQGSEEASEDAEAAGSAASQRRYVVDPYAGIQAVPGRYAAERVPDRSASDLLPGSHLLPPVSASVIENFTLTFHAASRAIDMFLSPDDIMLCLTAPEHTVPDPKSADNGSQCVYYVRGEIACVVDFTTTPKTVVTIVWRRDDVVTHGFARNTQRFVRD